MAWNEVYKEDSWQTAVELWVRHLDDFGRRHWTIVQYRSEATRFGEWAATEGLQPPDVNRAHIERYVSYMRDTRNLAPRSVAARLTALRTFFEWMVRQDLMAVNPARAVPNPKFRKPLPQVLPSDQLDVLLELPRRRGDGLWPRRDDALLKTLAWTGVRVSELVRLDWDHLDLTPGRATLMVVDGKGGKDRVVPVVEALCSSLLHYLELRLPLGHRRAVWVGQHSDRLTPRGVREIVRKYSLRMGVKLSPHRLRAQCGVELIRAGASLPEVRAVLGHAGYDTLLPYTALAADEARSALERVARPDRRKGEAHG